MNLAVFELFPCLLHAKQNWIRPREWKRQVNKMQTQRDRPNSMSSGYSKELNVQNVSYFMLFVDVVSLHVQKQHQTISQHHTRKFHQTSPRRIAFSRLRVWLEGEPDRRLYTYCIWSLFWLELFRASRPGSSHNDTKEHCVTSPTTATEELMFWRDENQIISLQTISNNHLALLQLKYFRAVPNSARVRVTVNPQGFLSSGYREVGFVHF